ncbi:MAG TPA: anti-sigma factor [Acidimicrobiales bacterium]|nr:anti-sigma factor [Acidimicrobiales bacterium]
MTGRDPGDLDAAAEQLATVGDTGGDPAGGRLGTVRRMLADEDMWANPPPELAEDVISWVGAPAPAAPRRGVGRRRWPALAGAGTLAAAIALAAALLADSRPGAREGDPTEVALAGTELAPGAGATATVRETPLGFAVTLRTGGLPPPPPDSYYQAWLKGPRGAVTIGTFHARGAEGEPVDLWSGVDPADYPTLTVTLEPEDGDPASSGRLVLSGRVG